MAIIFYTKLYGCMIYMQNEIIWSLCDRNSDCMIVYYIPRIRRIGGCYGFTSKPPAARHPPPAMVLTR